MRHYLVILFVVLLLITPWFAFNYPNELNSFVAEIGNGWHQLAAVIIHNPKTVAGLQSTYNIDAARGTAKIRILVVPGHSPDTGGAEYGSLKERDMTVELSQDLMQFLSNNPRYEVFTTRDTKSWNSTFTAYFKNDWSDIIAWESAHKNEVIDLMKLGQYHEVVPAVFHNTAPLDAALRLYGIDKWSNENNIDIVIHVHFNDYPGHTFNGPGKYSGFAIYVPEKQYLNSSTTQAVAQTVFKRLSKYNPVSNFPGEKDGIVEDQDLIAVGSYNSVDAASMLIEYGYIYEPQFTDDSLRSLAMKDLAYETYLGVQDFFDPTSASLLAKSYDTLVLPHAWWSPITKGSTASRDIYALQTALLSNGLYPPPPQGMNDCPRTGKFGSCTMSALDKFQEQNGVSGEKGVVGMKTLEVLNREFGAKSL